MIEQEQKNNTFSSPFYWREYPERDIEYVRWYPCAIGHLEENDIWSHNNPLVLYVHIPFCNNVCSCCIYNKFNANGPLLNKYLDALKAEIANYAQRPHIRDSEIISGYIGGGTPAVLSTAQLDDLLTYIFKHFNMSNKDARFTFTIETTPNEIDEEKAIMLHNHGIDRISIGAQSFDDVLLNRIGRTHTGQKVKEAVGIVRKAGFEHICVDLMYGLPGQTIEQWEKTLDEWLSLRVDSLGFYPYLLIPGSKLALQIQRGTIPPTPPQETLDRMFEIGTEKLLSNGYFACTPNELGRETKADGGIKWSDYNVKTYDVGPKGFRGVITSTFPRTTHIAHSWYEGGELLGIGSGAYGYMKNYWYLNEPDIHKYMEMVKNGKLPTVAGTYISKEEAIAKFMVMGTKFLKLLRTDFEKKFGIDMMQVYEKEIKQLEEWGLIEMSKESLQVTYPKGWYYLDNINKFFYTAANYRMPQSTLTNTNILKFLKKECMSNG